MVNHTFELNVDQWKFVGHPFSVQNEAFDIKFNIVFIVEVKKFMLMFTLIVCNNIGMFHDRYSESL